MKDIVLAPIYLVYKLWIGFVFWLSLMLLYIPFRILLSKTAWYEAAFKLKRGWAMLLSTLIFCPVKIKSAAPLPEGPCVIVSNHTSHLDTVFMYRIIPKYYAFVGKGELLKWPLFRLFFRTSDIPVDRTNGVKAYQSLQKAYDLLAQGKCIAIYPEGTIPDSNPRMKAFKNGAFKMAADMNVPVVPITWLTNYRIMNNPEKLFSPSLPNTVEVIIHPPIYPQGNNEQDLIALRQQAFRVINDGLPEAFRKHNQQEEKP